MFLMRVWVIFIGFVFVGCWQSRHEGSCLSCYEYTLFFGSGEILDPWPLGLSMNR